MENNKIMKSITDIQVENKALQKELRIIQNKIDENLVEYEKSIIELTKEDVAKAKEQIQKIYEDIASVSSSNGMIKIRFKKTENFVRVLYPIKTFIEEKIEKPGMFNITGSNINSYGEYKTIILTLTKKYLKENYNL